MRKTANQIKYFTPKELKEIFSVLENNILTAKTTHQKRIAIRNAAMIKVMYYCALRVSELTNLKVWDYDTFQKEIYCTRFKSGKSNTLLIVDSDVIFSLQRHVQVNHPQKYLFESTRTPMKELSRKTCDQIVREVCSNTQIQDSSKFHCHTFRHTMAIRLLEDGCSIYDVQYWLGHRDISNTQIYLAFTSNQQKRLYKMLEKASKSSAYIPKKLDMAENF